MTAVLGFSHAPSTIIGSPRPPLLPVKPGGVVVLILPVKCEHRFIFKTLCSHHGQTSNDERNRNSKNISYYALLLDFPLETIYGVIVCLSFDLDLDT